MIILSELEKGKVFAWDVDNMLTTCQVGTLTAEVLEWTFRNREGSPLVTCRSKQTRELFQTDAAHLTSLEDLEYKINYIEDHPELYKKYYTEPYYQEKFQRMKEAILSSKPELIYLQNILGDET